MKVIEGTPEEINEYLNKTISTPNTKKLASGVSMSSVIKKYVLEDESHWSTSKRQWVKIKTMDSRYIINVLRKMIVGNTADWLLSEDEFKSLIINLSNKIIEEE